MFLFHRGQPRVSVGQARSRTSGGMPDAVLPDVREEPEGNEEHAPSAVPVPLSKLVADTDLPSTATDWPLVVNRRSGYRPQQAAKPLTESGAQAVGVKGGREVRAVTWHLCGTNAGTTAR